MTHITDIVERPRPRWGNITLDERIWSKVKKTADCWWWGGQLNDKGYGTISVLRKDGTRTMMYVHRVVYLLKHKKIPEDKCVLHLCDNPQCVNPDHLWLGSMKDNSQDMVKKGRGKLFNKGQNSPLGIWEKITPRDAKIIQARGVLGEFNNWLAAEYGLEKSYVSRIVNGKVRGGGGI
jgi:hypothetical protein